jgi:lipoprotein-releasing system permease protein
VSGKFFEEDSAMIARIRALPSVAAVSITLEETAIFEYDDPPGAGIMKGVDEQYSNVNSIDSALIEGSFKLQDDETIYAVLGSGMARNLSVDVLNVFQNLSIHMPARQQKGGFQKPYQTRFLKPAGVFAIQQDIDNQYVLIPLAVARSLLDRPGAISSMEIKLQPDADEDSAKAEIARITGRELRVLNRYEQDESFLKLMNIEKWMAFLIACLMILLISFNLIGCLWMIVLDKRKDIAILKAMGGSDQFIRSIFLRLGLFFTTSGLVSGILLAILLYVAQKQFGLITMAQGFVVDTYPIKMKVSDLFIVAATVFIIGLIASLPASYRAARMGQTIRQT